MIYIGNKITSVDHLKPITIDQLVQAIRMPDNRMLNMIQQLRIAKTVSEKAYSELKKQLPYVVCSSLSPSIRKTSNFVYTEYFILDIDHISSQNESIITLRQRIQSDSRVLLCFVSPSEDGLKVLFRLKERCSDTGLYSLFYKSFARKFATQYSLEQVVDAKTSDVCRACFLSYDPNAYYNPDADAVDLKDYVDVENPVQVQDLRHELIVAEKEECCTELVKVENVEPGDAELARIREILEMKRRQKQVLVKDIYVPDELNAAMGDINDALNEVGVSIVEVRDINYGKKIRVSSGTLFGEINVFFGKRGFSVVETPKTGTDQRLNAMAAEIVELKLVV